VLLQRTWRGQAVTGGLLATRLPTTYHRLLGVLIVVMMTVGVWSSTVMT